MVVASMLPALVVTVADTGTARSAVVNVPAGSDALNVHSWALPACATVTCSEGTAMPPTSTESRLGSVPRFLTPATVPEISMRSLPASYDARDASTVMADVRSTSIWIVGERSPDGYSWFAVRSVPRSVSVVVLSWGRYAASSATAARNSGLEVIAPVRVACQGAPASPLPASATSGNEWTSFSPSYRWNVTPLVWLWMW